MTKHRILAALVSSALAAVVWFGGAAAASAAIDPPEPVFRDLAVSASSLSIDRTFITGKYTCTIPNNRLPRNIIPARFELWVQSHQMPFVPRNETYGVEIFPGDADLTDDHTTARVFR
jgi:hypothetical protein